MSSIQYPDRIDYSEGGFAVSVSHDGSIKVKPLAPAGYYNTIVIHHAGTHAYYYPMAVQIKHRYRGFDDIGYHFMIDSSGTIYECRRINYKGAHVGVANTGKLGHCHGIAS